MRKELLAPSVGCSRQASAMEKRSSLTLTLRPHALPAGVAPAGPLRDRQAEKRRALANATNKAVMAAPAAIQRMYTSASKGEATEAYAQLAAQKPLPIVARAASSKPETDSHRQRRLAAAARWKKVRLALGTITPSGPLESGQPSLVSSVPACGRAIRRGELDGLKASYRGYDTSELLDLVYKVRDQELKYTELKKLYKENKVRVPPSQVGKVLYPREGVAARIAALEQKGLVPMGAPHA